jgi:hypothetical protein
MSLLAKSLYKETQAIPSKSINENGVRVKFKENISGKKDALKEIIELQKNKKGVHEHHDRVNHSSKIEIPKMLEVRYIISRFTRFCGCCTRLTNKCSDRAYSEYSDKLNHINEDLKD